MWSAFCKAWVLPVSLKQLKAQSMTALSIHKSSDRSLALSRQHAASFHQQASLRACKIKHISVKATKQGLGVLMSVWIVLGCFFAALLLASCSCITPISPPMWSGWLLLRLCSWSDCQNTMFTEETVRWLNLVILASLCFGLWVVLLLKVLRLCVSQHYRAIILGDLSKKNY